MRPVTVHNRRRGLSLAEVSASTLLVGALIVTALQCLGSITRGRTSVADDARAEHLAQQLLVEILNDAYRDPGVLPLFGPEVGEPSTVLGPRSGWNDVDDYHGWSESPPQARDGSALANLTGWRREVVVQLVVPNNPANTSLLDQGLKRVTVTVKRNGEVMATRVGLRSSNYNVND
jgi:hypothetical protein